MTEAEWLTCTNASLMMGFLQDAHSGVWLGQSVDRRFAMFADAVAAKCPKCNYFIKGSTPAENASYTAGTSCGSPSEKAAIIRDIFGNPFRPVAVERGRPCNPYYGSCGLFAGHKGPHNYRAIRVDIDWLSWNDGIIPKLAQAIYDERAFDRMPILADALEEAGCTNEEMLMHCRGQEFVDGRTWAIQPLRGPHVRGCWVLDLLLGKE